MDDDQEQAEFDCLMQALPLAGTEVEREPIRVALNALHDRRAAEERDEQPQFVDAFGSGPEPSVVVLDGGTLHRLPIYVDRSTGRVTGNSFGDDWPPHTPVA